MRSPSIFAFVGCAIVAAWLLVLPHVGYAQLPNPTYGWNLGNAMEPPSGVGTWGGHPSKGLIDSVAGAGFNTVRIPCAWDSHADRSTHKIDPTYMSQVKQVVDWCYAKHLYVIVNDHWDDGWLENNIGPDADPTVEAKMKAYWTQIASAFAGYDFHLLFAAANEPNVKTAAQMATLMTYYGTFITAVRGEGGNNASRWLVIQGPDADIDKTMSLMTGMPPDPTPHRLMVEVHYYTPYQFTLMNSDQSWGIMYYFWGSGYHSATDPTRNAAEAEESYLDGEFGKMQTQFVSKGVPVVLGEFRAAPKAGLSSAEKALNYASTVYWDRCVVEYSQRHDIYPICWDTPGSLFDWSTGAVKDALTLHALTGRAPKTVPAE